MRQDHFLLQFLGHGTQNVSKHKIRPWVNGNYKQISMEIMYVNQKVHSFI
jgi:hypothetical protein